MPFHLHFCGTAAMLCASQALSLTADGFPNPLHPPKLCVLFFDLPIHPFGHKNRSFELSSFQMPALFTALPTSAKGLAASPRTEGHCGEEVASGGSKREHRNVPQSCPSVQLRKRKAVINTQGDRLQTVTSENPDLSHGGESCCAAVPSHSSYKAY